MMNQQYFKGIIEEYNQKMKDKEIIEDDINKNNLRKDIDKIDQEQDFIKSEIDRMKRELESEKKVTKKLKPCPKCGKEIPVDWTYHKECGWEEIKEEESAEIVGKCKIEVFTSPRCPHCHPALDLAKQIEKERDDVKVIELNTATPHGSRKARQLSIMAVPTIFVKGPSYPQDIGFRGLPSKKGLLKAIDISLGKAEWEEKKGFLKSIAEKIPIKIKW
jgi:thioredoxin 1